jgi:hypothetical protein
MAATITIEIPAQAEPVVRQVLALHEELQNLAVTAPDGTVLDVCEAAIVEKGSDLNARILAEAVARRIEAAEKRGHRSAPVPVAGPRRTAAAPPASS